MALIDKKALAVWKNKLALHTLLIMEQEKSTKSVASVQAYYEGLEGLAKRQLPAPYQAEPKKA